MLRVGSGVLVMLALVVGCAGRSTHDGASTGSGGPAAGAGGTSGAAGTSGTGGAMAGRTGEDACAPPSTDRNSPPGRKGCYTFENGQWVRFLCGCELPVENPSSERVAIELSFSAMLDGQTLSYTETPSAEVTVDDLDARYFDVWTRQVGSGTSFQVSHENGQTHIALGVPDLALEAVSLLPCEARYTMPRIIGQDSLVLHTSVRTTTLDGDVSSWESDCRPYEEPPRP